MAKKTKMVILGRIALLFGDSREEVYNKLGSWPDESAIIYKGKTPVPYKISEKIAPIHPGFVRYNEIALGVLYKGRGIFARGTENPALAVNSFALKHAVVGQDAEHFKYVLIWDPFE